MTKFKHNLLISIFLIITFDCNEGGTIVKEKPIITTQCEYYNPKECNSNGTSETCKKVDQCTNQGEGKRNHCYVYWTWDLNGNINNVSLKGCFLNNEVCFDQKECVQRLPIKNSSNQLQHMFCCCEGDFCNTNFQYQPDATTQKPQISMPVPTYHAKWPFYLVIAIILKTLTGLALFAFYCWKNKRLYFQEIPTNDPNPMPPPSPFFDNRPIQLEEIKARGRFGAVWKAHFKTEEIAVKIFPIQDKQSWLSEQEIFKLPYMNHPNILQYIGVEKHGDNLHAEFWLITAYHDRGSLCDFLKAHTLTLVELLLIAETISRGLMYLHEAVPGKNPYDPIKPVVAHRDFKSKNVLLKSDMSACIADFGLALVFERGRSCGDTHGQVGTRRYMAPEVLEGAIDFSSDAFLRIDMYACGLVLWELVSRCTAQDGPIAEYRLPFEDEVGQHPTLESMQESVVQKKVRPAIQDYWRHNTGLTLMCDTIEECWDHDAEARLSASCVLERVMMQSKYHH